LQRKKLDMIVANQVGEGKGFDSDENAVNIYWNTGEQSFSTAEKTELARDVLKLIAERFEIAYSSGQYAIN
jgi:phosphopantothenoylcysteine decarboxylase/phosphopantothenate--cysteine ligase